MPDNLSMQSASGEHSVHVVKGLTAPALEDALAYLPRKPLVEYARGAAIFDSQQPSRAVYLLTQGAVKVSAAAEDGVEVLIDVCRADEFFGEGALLGSEQPHLRAVTLDKSYVMSWTPEEIEEQIQKQPRLGIALIQAMVQRASDRKQRIEALAAEKTGTRVIRGLLWFCERIGARQEDGSVRLPPLTHQTIASMVCTSREIVTFNMNKLRQQAYLKYSRRGIEVWDDAMREMLRNLTLNESSVSAAPPPKAMGSAVSLRLPEAGDVSPAR